MDPSGVLIPSQLSTLVVISININEWESHEVEGTQSKRPQPVSFTGTELVNNVITTRRFVYKQSVNLGMIN